MKNGPYIINLFFVISFKKAVADPLATLRDHLVSKKVLNKHQCIPQSLHLIGKQLRQLPSYLAIATQGGLLCLLKFFSEFKIGLQSITVFFPPLFQVLFIQRLNVHRRVTNLFQAPNLCTLQQSHQSYNLLLNPQLSSHLLQSLPLHLSR